MTSNEKLQRAVRALGKKEVARILERHLVVSGDEAKTKKGITFKELSDIWKEKVLPLHKPSSRSSELGRLTALLAAFGKSSLDTLTTERLQNWVTGLSCSTRTTTNYVSLFRAIWKMAVDYGYVTGDPFSGLRLPSPELRELPVFSPPQAYEIISRAEEPYRTMFLLAACTGLRVGELIGLRASDIDFESGFLSVQRSVYKRSVGTTKTGKGVRTVKLARPMLEHLYKFVGLHNRVLHNSILFTTNGSVMSYETVLGRLKSILLAMGIDTKGAGLHCFRRLAASVYGSVGASDSVVQKTLGHSSYEMSKHYMSPMPDDQTRAAESVWGVLQSRGVLA